MISRVATDETRNACSCLYGALCRAAKALGYTEAWTYTHADEPGTSLRAANFTNIGLNAGGGYSRQSRERTDDRDLSPRRRWMRRLVL